MIVTDTNVIGYLFLSSGKSRLSELTLRKDTEWAAPVLWRGELRNVLAYYMRKTIIALYEVSSRVHLSRWFPLMYLPINLKCVSGSRLTLVTHISTIIHSEVFCI